MQACRSHKEILILDVFGEIADPQARLSWQAHLGTCAGCRLERQRMAGLVADLRAAGRPPELTAAGAQTMAVHVRKALAGRVEHVERGAVRARRRFMGLPALAAASALAVISVAGYLAQDRIFGPERVAGLGAEMQLPEQDLDVIRNLELLKELDTIEKLVRVVDPPDNGQAPDDGPQPATQGMKTDGSDHGYA